MPIHNSDVARIFTKVADLLDITGANPFRVRAYRNAAQTIGNLTQSVDELIADGEDLTELSGIGDDLAQKIHQIVETGSLDLLEDLTEELDPAILDLLKIEGLGPKRVKKLHDALEITTLDALEEAARAGKVQAISGFGEKTEQKILDGLDAARKRDERTLLMKAERIVEPLLDYLHKADELEDAVAAGSYRRRKETVGDIDILAISSEGEKLSEHFVTYEDVKQVLSQGATKSSVVLRSNLQADLRVVPEESYGAAILYFTGSKDHNVALRGRAVDRNLKINEYGVFKDDDTRVAGESEEEIYELFDLDVIPPELRENRGELEAAQNNRLPDLITREDIRGDLQSHTTASDGKNSLREMAKKAAELGHDYLAITDHSKYVGITNGLDADRLAQQIEEIGQLNRELDDIRLLKSSEVDIKTDGSLTLPDGILQELDLVLIAIHSNFGLSEEEQTERVVKAMEHPLVDIFAHPTGRRLGSREAYDLDVERVLQTAKEQDCFVELNAQPERLDLNDIYCKRAKELGVKVAISTDAHTTGHLAFMRYGIHQARRGWLEPDDVLNTRSWSDLKKLLDGS